MSRKSSRRRRNLGKELTLKYNISWKEARQLLKEAKTFVKGDCDHEDGFCPDEILKVIAMIKEGSSEEEEESDVVGLDVSIKGEIDLEPIEEEESECEPLTEEEMSQSELSVEVTEGDHEKNRVKSDQERSLYSTEISQYKERLKRMEDTLKTEQKESPSEPSEPIMEEEGHSRSEPPEPIMNEEQSQSEPSPEPIIEEEQSQSEPSEKEQSQSSSELSDPAMEEEQSQSQSSEPLFEEIELGEGGGETKENDKEEQEESYLPSANVDCTTDEKTKPKARRFSFWGPRSSSDIITKKERPFIELVWKKKQSLGIGVTKVKSKAKDLRVVEFLEGSPARELCIEKGMKPDDLIGAKIVGVNGNCYLNKEDLYDALTDRSRTKRIMFRLADPSDASTTDEEDSSDECNDDEIEDLNSISNESEEEFSNDGNNNEKVEDLKRDNQKLRKEFLRIELDHSTEMARLISAMQIMEQEHQKQLAQKEMEIGRLEGKLKTKSVKTISSKYSSFSNDITTKDAFAEEGKKDEINYQKVSSVKSNPFRSKFNSAKVNPFPEDISSLLNDGVKHNFVEV